MKKYPFAKILTGLSIVLGVTSGFSWTPSNAQIQNTENLRFFCDTSISPPTSFGRSSRRGLIPMIEWTQTWAIESGWTPAIRCQHVSQKFQAHFDNGTLKFIRTGNINNHPVLCIAWQKSGDCREEDILLTLAPGSNADEVLQQLLALNRAKPSGALQLSDGLVFYVDGEVYIDIELFLERVAETESMTQPTTEPTIKPNEDTELWPME